MAKSTKGGKSGKGSKTGMGNAMMGNGGKKGC